MPADFTCLGDITQDIFFFIHDASLHTDLKTDDCQLILKYGQKIPVEDIAQSAGGNAANVAVGLSRLGIKTKLVTIFGGDSRGAWLKREMLQNGVDLHDSVTDDDRVSNLSSIIVFKGERTILTYHSFGKDLLPAIPSTDWLYATSSSGRDSKVFHAQVVKFKQDHPRSRLCLNPSMHDLKNEQPSLKNLLKFADIVILNWEEAEVLVNHESSKSDGEKNQNVKTMLKEITELGPKIVSITDGVAGAYAADGEKTYYCPIIEVEVKETTGAGDAFSSGFLAALFHDKSVPVAMKWGMGNSRNVVMKVGGQAGLITKKFVEESATINRLAPTEI